MPITVTCPNCRAALELSSDLAGTDVRCGSCNAVFTATPSNNPDDLPTARPTRRAARSEPDDDYGERPRRGRRASGSSNRWVYILLGIGSLLGCACCGGFGWLVYMMMNPEFVTFESQELQFAASFYGTPTQKTSLTGRKGGESAEGFESVREIFQEKFFVYSLPIPDKDKDTPHEKLADEFAAGLVSTITGGVEQKPRQKVGVQGNDGVDVAVRGGDGRFTIARAVVSQKRIYVIGVTGPGQPDGSPWVEEFIESLQVLGEDDDMPAPEQKKRKAINPPPSSKKSPPKVVVPNDDDN